LFLFLKQKRDRGKDKDRNWQFVEKSYKRRASVLCGAEGKRTLLKELLLLYCFAEAKSFSTETETNKLGGSNFSQ
jgi:hypothetical protein